MKNKIYWIDYIKQLLIFGIGFVGYQILSFVLVFAFGKITDSNELLGLMLINLVSYFSVFIFQGICLFKDIKGIAKKTISKHTILFGVIAGAILVICSEGLSLLLSLAYKGTNSNQQLAVNLIKSYPAFAIIILGFIGPIVEELTYRLGLFSFCSRINRILAYVVTILIFSLIHFDFTSSDMIAELISLPVYMLGAVILTYTYEKSGPTSSIIAHSINNLLSVILILCGVGN